MEERESDCCPSKSTPTDSIWIKLNLRDKELKLYG